MRNPTRRAVARLLAFAIAATALAACGGDGPSDDEPAPTTSVSAAQATATSTEVRATATNTAPPTNTRPPTATATPTPAPIGLSRTNPAPIGSAVLIGNWLIQVNSVTPDATAAVRAQNSFNKAPDAGRQFFIVNVTATYQGTKEPSQLFIDVTVKSVGQSSVSYSGADSCGVIPAKLDDFKDVFKGGAITGNICWSVTTADVTTLTMYIATSFSTDSQTRWFKLQP